MQTLKVIPPATSLGEAIRNGLLAPVQLDTRVSTTIEDHVIAFLRSEFDIAEMDLVAQAKGSKLAGTPLTIFRRLATSIGLKA